MMMVHLVEIDSLMPEITKEVEKRREQSKQLFANGLAEASSVSKPMKKPAMAIRPLTRSAYAVKHWGSRNSDVCLVARLDSIISKTV